MRRFPVAGVSGFPNVRTSCVCARCAQVLTAECVNKSYLEVVIQPHIEFDLFAHRLCLTKGYLPRCVCVSEYVLCVHQRHDKVK